MTEAVQLVNQLVQGLQALGQQPAQPGQEQAVSQARQQLNERLADAPSNHFSPAWREALDELGIADVLGNELRRRIEEIFDRNEITPSAAATELQPIADRLNGLNNALEQLQQSLGFLGIGAEELHPGEFEIGFLIPRAAVDESLEKLGYEFLRLRRILGPLQEVATGTREDIEIRSLSSSAFQVFLHSHEAVALLLATTLERLISSYEKIMNIRLAYKQLKESDVDEKALAAVEASAEKKMADDIKVLVGELLKQASGLDSARRNELRKELTDSLNALANRIDRGYSMEVRAGELPEPDEEDEESASKEDEELTRIVEAVLAVQERLKFTNVTGTPILGLPEGTDESEQAGGSG